MKNYKYKDGRQLLIEYDAGHVSPAKNEHILSEIKESDFSKDLILYAVLQKYDTPNKNGRIYPESVLKREIEKYQTIIKKGGALNELNHPSCHTDDVEVFTKDGWKNITTLDEFEDVYTLDNLGNVSLNSIYSKVKHQYKGKMFNIKGKHIDTTVTPNHKFPLINQKGLLSFITAEEIFQKFKNKNSLTNLFIPKIFNKEEKNNKVKGVYLDNRFLKITEIDFDGFVYSIDVKNHTYYVRSNDKCHWTGNSSLIDLDRVSHSILETWWEGKVLMGKIKLFTSPGWKKMGIVSTKGDQAAMLLLNGATLGISSRGVGSLSNIKGQNIVQDDFELVCFDLVSSPSTPGAYVFSDPSEREIYDESIENNNTKSINNVKNLMTKLDSFLGK